MTAEKEQEDSANFVSRWSRLKAEARLKSAAAAGREPAKTAVEASEPAHSRQPEGETSHAGQAPEEEVPLADLPRIEDIDAKTDLTPWLAKKVPAAWRAAALRKAWSADPAIAQFIGLSENAWDWNAPEGVPGFGPPGPLDNIGELLAQAMGTVRKTASQPELATSGQIADAGDTVSPEAQCGDQAIAQTEGLTASVNEVEVDEKPTEYQTLGKKKRGGSALPA